MNIDTESRHVTPVGGNIYLDLGFSADEAATLQARTQSIISQKQADEDPPEAIATAPVSTKSNR
ncbi:MAG: hypothetical protein KJZ96_14615 [Rhodocyclaceae bacterium]|nr:hypothetical protein [Rhodocyclaceae bacterium]